MMWTLQDMIVEYMYALHGQPVSKTLLYGAVTKLFRKSYWENPVGVEEIDKAAYRAVCQTRRNREQSSDTVSLTA